MSDDDEPQIATYVAETEEEFPIRIEFIAVRTGEVVHTVIVNGPGVADVPPLARKFGPVRVRMTMGDGEVVEAEPPV